MDLGLVIPFLFFFLFYILFPLFRFVVILPLLASLLLSFFILCADVGFDLVKNCFSIRLELIVVEVILFSRGIF